MGLFDILSSAAEALADQGKREKERRREGSTVLTGKSWTCTMMPWTEAAITERLPGRASEGITDGIPVLTVEENSEPPRWTWTTSSRKVGAAETPWIICSTSVPTAIVLREIARTIQKRTWREEEENCGIEIREIQTCLMKSAGIGIR